MVTLTVFCVRFGRPYTQNVQTFIYAKPFRSCLYTFCLVECWAPASAHAQSTCLSLALDTELFPHATIVVSFRSRDRNVYLNFPAGNAYTVALSSIIVQLTHWPLAQCSNAVLSLQARRSLLIPTLVASTGEKLLQPLRMMLSAKTPTAIWTHINDVCFPAAWQNKLCVHMSWRKSITTLFCFTFSLIIIFSANNFLHQLFRIFVAHGFIVITIYHTPFSLTITTETSRHRGHGINGRNGGGTSGWIFSLLRPVVPPTFGC